MECLGLPLVRFLQVFLGSVKSLNVRNLLWHGYLLPDDLTTTFYLCLLNIAATIGRDVFKGSDILHRPVPSSFPDFDELDYYQWFGDACVRAVSGLETMIHVSPAVHEKARPLWDHACQLAIAKEYVNKALSSFLFVPVFLLDYYM